MKKSLIILIAVLFVGLFAGVNLYQKFENASVPTVSAAAVDYFLKIEGIEGEVTEPGHMGEIMVESWSWGQTQPGVQSPGGTGGGKANFQDFHFVMQTSKASPKLMLAAAKGEHIKQAVLTTKKTDKDQAYLTIKLSDILISSYLIGGSSSAVPTDQISLNFGKIEFEYKPKKGESVKGGWDVGGNKPL